jgi:phosphoglycerate dehydrogenase-like enzyme
LLNKTIGLIGLGAVGKQVAKHLRGFVATVIYYNPVRPSAKLERSLGVSYTEFDDLVRRSDIVSLHLQLLPETAGIINAERILAMKKGTVLINCARGGVVDEAALAAALKEGHLFGAGIEHLPASRPSAASCWRWKIPSSPRTLPGRRSIILPASSRARW